MSEREMFEASFNRPKNFFTLSESNQWIIDGALGILDWTGLDWTGLDWTGLVMGSPKKT